MNLRLEYLIVHNENINQIIFESWKEALGGSSSKVFEDSEIVDSINSVRRASRGIDPPEWITSLRIEIDLEVEDIKAILESFHQRLLEGEDDGILHVTKLFDSVLKQQLARYASEIFDLEMRIREALSLIFIDTYGPADGYDLLKESSQSMMKNEAPSPENLRMNLENELFYILFNQYSVLNEREPISGSKPLLSYIAQAADFEALRAELLRKPIVKATYVDFLTGLKVLVDPIEKLRNCVAHNRSISKRRAGNYATAKEQLERHIEEFWTEIAEGELSLWEEEALVYLVRILESAVWDFDAGTVTIYEDYDTRFYYICSSPKELLVELTQIAEREAYGVIQYEAGEPVWEFDGIDTVLSVLAGYEDELKEMGWDDEL